jgi:hypothetical protein
MLNMYGLESSIQAIPHLNQQMQQHAGIETAAEGKMITSGAGQFAQDTLESL